MAVDMFTKVDWGRTGFDSSSVSCSQLRCLACAMMAVLYSPSGEFDSRVASSAIHLENTAIGTNQMEQPLSLPWKSRVDGLSPRDVWRDKVEKLK